jgi:hypothetical protein
MALLLQAGDFIWWYWDAQQRLDGAAFVHRPAALGDFGDRQFQVEYAARLDLALRRK